MLASAEAILGAYAKTLLVDRAALKEAREADDVMMAFQTPCGAHRTRPQGRGTPRPWG